MRTVRIEYLRWLALATPLLSLACEAQVVSGGWTDEGATPNAASVAAKCAVPDQAPILVTDHATLVTLLTGRWYRCGDADPAIGFAPAAIEFTSSYQWYTLVPNASGIYVPSTEVGESGLVAAEKVFAACCPDDDALTFDGGNHSDILAFESSPTRMSWSYDTWSNDGVEVRTVGARYVQ